MDHVTRLTLLAASLPGALYCVQHELLLQHGSGNGSSPAAAPGRRDRARRERRRGAGAGGRDQRLSGGIARKISATVRRGWGHHVDLELCVDTVCLRLSCGPLLAQRMAHWYICEKRGSSGSMRAPATLADSDSVRSQVGILHWRLRGRDERESQRREGAAGIRGTRCLRNVRLGELFAAGTTPDADRDELGARFR